MFNQPILILVVVLGIVLFVCIGRLIFNYANWIGKNLNLLPNLLKWLSFAAAIATMGYLWETATSEFLINRIILSLITVGMLIPLWFAIVSFTLPTTNKQSSALPKRFLLSMLLALMAPLTFSYLDLQFEESEHLHSFRGTTQD